MGDIIKELEEAWKVIDWMKWMIGKDECARTDQEDGMKDTRTGEHHGSVSRETGTDGRPD